MVPGPRPRRSGLLAEVIVGGSPSTTAGRRSWTTPCGAFSGLKAAPVGKPHFLLPNSVVFLPNETGGGEPMTEGRCWREFRVWFWNPRACLHKNVREDRL